MPVNRNALIRYQLIDHCPQHSPNALECYMPSTEVKDYETKEEKR